MRYDRRRAGLRLQPSDEGLIRFVGLQRDTRAVLLGERGQTIRIKRDGIVCAERWAREFWIPLRGNRQWRHGPQTHATARL